jgi:pSer/pThr/pTyr-binding forkhead associated (FHA) protein
MVGIEEDSNSGTNKPEENQIPEEAFLVVGGMIFPLEKSIFKIGRNLENDLVLNDPSVSRFHAEIQYKEGQFLLIDKNSSTGTFLNNRKIRVNPLFAGDILQISHTPIMFMFRGASLMDRSDKKTGNLG